MSIAEAVNLLSVHARKCGYEEKIGRRIVLKLVLGFLCDNVGEILIVF